ncbi:MAG: hypothetical protein EXR68_07160 [Dehalococcoidia bacterium]|nr:hypothetical protein [Dehalococcoidia bacterium]
MLSELLRRFRPDPLRARVEDSIRRGTGLSRQEWLLGDDLLGRTDLEHLAEQVIEWCRDRLAATKRPYGIDQMALAIACAEPGGQPLASTTFWVFRPIGFYKEAGVGERARTYLTGLPLDDLNRRTGGIRFAAALFSWGGVARDTIFADEPNAAREASLRRREIYLV